MTELQSYLGMIDRAQFCYELACHAGRVTITVETTDSSAGYSGFTAVHIFDQDTGRLIAVGGSERP